MIKHTMQIAGLVLVATLAHTVSAGQQPPPTRPQPQILSVAVDLAQQLIVIVGRDLDSASPSVKLGGQALGVKTLSTGQRVVDLPAGVPSATYLLTIGDERDPTKSNSFNIEIFVTAQLQQIVVNVILKDNI
jgi:hypothetical protein